MAESARRISLLRSVAGRVGSGGCARSPEETARRLKSSRDVGVRHDRITAFSLLGGIAGPYCRIGSSSKGLPATPHDSLKNRFLENLVGCDASWALRRARVRRLRRRCDG